MLLVFVPRVNPVDPQRREEELDHIVDDLDSTEDGEASEETHRPANEAKSGL